MYKYMIVFKDENNNKKRCIMFADNDEQALNIFYKQTGKTKEDILAMDRTLFY